MKKREIIRADTMGFCMGVQRAVTIVEELLEKQNRVRTPIYTLGPLIHNRLFVEKLQQKGITELSDPDDGDSGTVVIRAHGIAPEMRSRLNAKTFDIIDATCPKVLRSHKKVAKYSSKGYTIIVVGNASHGEVVGLAGHADNPIVIQTREQAERVELPANVMVIAQTTVNATVYREISTIISKRGKKVEVVNSLCGSVDQRQKALRKLAPKVDAVLVIGGKNSANTRNLFETSLSLIEATWHIESVEEIPEEVYRYHRIGLTAGASTPDWLIDEVERALKEN